MKRTLAVVLVSSLFFIPVHAESFYAGIQTDANAIGLIFGKRIDRTYSVEANLVHAVDRIEHSGVSVDTTTTMAGISGLARLPMKLADGQPYALYGRAGAAYVSREESYNIPTSVTLTQPYSGKTTSHGLKPILGGGVELDLSKSLTGRVELTFTGHERTVNMAAMFAF